MEEAQDDPSAAVKIYGLWVGLAAGFIIFALPTTAALGVEAHKVAAVGIVMAIWWASEAVPVAITALVPLVAFPFLGIGTMENTAAPYADPLIFLFLGGFVLALAIERCDLHRRIALAIVGQFGGRPRATVGGFMLASAILSMWISNTATALMMLPIARSASHPPSNETDAENRTSSSGDVTQSRNYGTALLLGVAYACSIGGLGTLIGTPPNALLAAYLGREQGITIGFAQWMLVGLPVVAVMLPACWFVLVRVVFPLPAKMPDMPSGHLRTPPPPLDVAQRRTAAVALIVAILWIGRPWLSTLPALQGVSDTGVALVGALALFLIPADGLRGDRLMDWPTAKRLPWEVLLLFGGGLSLAGAVGSSGLAVWIGSLLTGMSGWPLLPSVAVTALLVLFLTELTSNTATAASFLPVAAAVALGMGTDPIALTVAVALAASCAFMLPVATPPNAIVYGSGQVTIGQMIRAGLIMNLIGILIISVVASILAPWIIGVSL